MILIIDTTGNEEMINEIESGLNGRNDYEIIRAKDMKIGHCIGCNYCWLKDPGICSVKDDHETILKKMILSDQIWLVSGTTLGFITPLAKNIIDRIIPLATMNLKFKGKQMRHELRYKSYQFGLIYDGEADKAFMEHWSDRVAINFGSRTKGAFKREEIKEAVSCMC